MKKKKSKKIEKSTCIDSNNTEKYKNVYIMMESEEYKM